MFLAPLDIWKALNECSSFTRICYFNKNKENIYSVIEKTAEDPGKTRRGVRKDNIIDVRMGNLMVELELQMLSGSRKFIVAQ